MQRIKRKRIAVIQAESSDLFEIAINKKYDELADYSLTLEIEHHQPHTAYIHYEVDEYIPESLADEFRIKGITYKCENCQYAEPLTKSDGTADRRTSKMYCHHHKKYVVRELDACDIYYFELASKTGQFSQTDNTLDVSVKQIEHKKHKAPKHTKMGSNLKALREAKGVSMSEVARQIGVSVNGYRSWEIGAVRISMRNLELIADYYGCNVSDILVK